MMYCYMYYVLFSAGHSERRWTLCEEMECWEWTSGLGSLPAGVQDWKVCLYVCSSVSPTVFLSVCTSVHSTILFVWSSLLTYKSSTLYFITLTVFKGYLLAVEYIYTENKFVISINPYHSF